MQHYGNKEKRGEKIMKSYPTLDITYSARQKQEKPKEEPKEKGHKTRIKKKKKR